MLASFSIVPVGAGEELKEQIAEIVALIEASGLHFKLGAMQTTVEGDFDAVMDLIKRCHHLARRSNNRVLTHIAIDDRAGATDRLTGKVKDVEAILGREVSHE